MGNLTMMRHNRRLHRNALESSRFDHKMQSVFTKFPRILNLIDTASRSLSHEKKIAFATW